MNSLIAFSHTGVVGGAEKALAELLHSLNTVGWSTRCIVPAEGRLLDLLASQGTSVEVIRSQGWATLKKTVPTTLRSTVRNATATSLVVRRLRTEVHSTWLLSNTITNPLGALVARSLGLRHITYAHEFGVQDHHLDFVFGFERSIRLLSRLSTVFIANSLCTSDFFSSLLRREVPVVPYSMGLAGRSHQPLGLRTNSFRVLVLGRLSEGKNQLEAVRAAGMLKAWAVPISLRIVGGGDATYRRAMREEAKSLGLGAAFSDLPEVDDPSGEIDMADIVVVPSCHEAFGRVTVEAMLRSRPVIGANNAGTKELVSHGVTGLLYEPGDHVALAEALRRAWEDWDRVRDWSSSAYLLSADRFNDRRTTAAFASAVSDE